MKVVSAARLLEAAGLLACTAADEAGQVTVDMGAPKFGWADIPLDPIKARFDGTAGMRG